MESRGGAWMVAGDASSGLSGPAAAAAGLDESVLLGVSGGCPELAAELLETFLLQLPGERERLRDAVARRDAGAIREIAHRLAGSLGLVGARSACQIARRLERMGRDRRLDDVEAVWSTLEAVLAELSPAVAAWRRRLLAEANRL